MRRMNLGAALRAALGVLGVALMTCTAAAVQVSENFDVDPPNWVGVNNTVGLNNFGWSNTNNVGLGAGEAGGGLERDAEGYIAYYATNVGSLDPSSDTLQFSGTAVYKAPNNDYFQIGYFNPTTGAVAGDGRLKNYIGLYSDSRNISVIAYADGMLTQSPWLTVGEWPIDAPWTWDLTYDPAGNGGLGNITGTVAGTAVDMNLPAGRKDLFANLTHYGIVSRNNSDANRVSVTFVDNLSYTVGGVVPEPASGVLLTIAMLGILAGSRGARFVSGSNQGQ